MSEQDTAYWQQQLLNLERNGADYDSLASVWECAKASITNEEDCVSVYRTFIYLTHRHLVKTGATSFELVEELFKECFKLLNDEFEDGLADSSIQLRKNFAYYLYTKSKKPKQAHSIWTEINSISAAADTAAHWLELIGLERHFGELANARRHFYTAVDWVTDYPYDIFGAFVQFEREEGTLEELERALEKVNSQVRHVANRKPSRAPKEGKKANKNKRPKAGGAPTEDDPMEGISPKKSERKRASSKDDENIPSKVPKNAKKMTPIVDEDGFKQPLLPPPRKNSANKEKQSKEVENGEQQTSSFLAEMEVTENPTAPIEFESTFKYGTGVERNKLFVRNVHFATTDDELKEHFSKFGQVESVRIVTHKDGKPKGVAYIDFFNDGEAEKGLRANDSKLRDRKLKVFVSNPPPKGVKRDDFAVDVKPKPFSAVKMTAKQLESVPTMRVPRAGQLFVPRTLAKAGASSRNGINNNNNRSEASTTGDKVNTEIENT